MRLKIHGARNIPASGPAILVANHVSELDSNLLQSATPRTLFFSDFSHHLQQGDLVCIFPEGNPSRTGTIETFGTEVEGLIDSHPDALVLPVCICTLSAKSRTALAIGSPLQTPITGTSLRQHVAELSCDAVEYCKSDDSTLAHRFIQNAREHWNERAISDSSKKALTYGETLTTALLFRDWLDQGPRQQEKNVGVYLPSSVGAALVNYGITLAAKVAVNLNFTAGEQNCRAAIAQCEIQTIFSSRMFLEKANLPQWPEMVFLEDLFPQFTGIRQAQAALSGRSTPISTLTKTIRPDSTACILFSSGSTGVPKGVELTHWNILANADGCAAVVPAGHEDCMLGVLPFFHSFGYTFALWFPILTGFRAVYHANPTDAKIIGELAEAHRATFFLSTPTFCLQYARKCEPQQFSTLKYILVGAEKLRDSVDEEFHRHFGIRLLAGYGCTELGPGVAINRPDVFDGETVHCGTRPGSVGRPLPGIAIRIVDPETLSPLPPRQQGMVLVKGPSRMPGYYRAPESTAKVLLDGYYITGDLGYVDEDGFLYITDRLARFSKVAGEMIPHLRIEEAVSDLTMSFVTGVPDARRGERLVMLYTNPAVAPADLLARLNKCGIPPLWIPKRDDIHSVPSIPALASGKVDLKQARALASAQKRTEAV